METENNDKELGCDALLSAFDAKIADCERRAKECYEDRAEDCRSIGDYWNAARIEIARFRNELFPDNANCGGAAAHDSETTTDGNGGCLS